VRIPEELAIVVCDTGVKHTLAGGGFNERREDCRAAVRRLSERRAGVQSLRDVSLDEIADAAPRLGPRLLRRVRHVVGENARVLDTVAALEAGDLGAVGTAMAASHDSLRLDYEVSCPELDLLVDLTRPLAGVVGTRMTGGGFGGSTVSLVHRDAVPDLLDAVASGYRDATGRVVRTFVTRPVAGASELRSS
jgi:galactokinase